MDNTQKRQSQSDLAQLDLGHAGETSHVSMPNAVHTEKMAFSGFSPLTKIKVSEPKIETPHPYLVTLQETLLEYCKSFKISQSELLSIATKLAHQHATPDEVVSFMEFIMFQELFDVIVDSDEELLRPKRLSALEISNWEVISRSRSKDFVRNFLFTPSYFSRSLRIFNKIFKIATTNRAFLPLNHSCVQLSTGSVCTLFSSNDYLGLSKHPDVIHAAKSATDMYGLGSGGSRILTGSTPLHFALEHKIAQLKSTEDAIIFSSGFLTNLALFSLLKKDALVFYDSLIHTSILDGMKLAGVNGIRFRHNDASHLESRLRQHESEQKLIIIEGVYSMDGDIAPLPEIVSLAKRYHAYLAVDEAHSFGTLGKTGLGVAQHFSLKEDDIDFKIGTLGKAVGSEGGYIAAKQCFVDLLRYSANSYIFTTSCVTPSVAGALAALSLIEHTHSHVEKLHQNSKYTRNKLVSMGFDIAESQTHIIPVIIPDDDAVISVQRELEQQGILMSLVTFPAVPLGKSRLRINITAAHTRKQINDMLEKLYQVALNHGIIT